VAAIDLANDRAVHVLGLEVTLKEQEREVQRVFKRQENSLLSKARLVSVIDCMCYVILCKA